jgi:hypothetical protein
MVELVELMLKLHEKNRTPTADGQRSRRRREEL